MDGARRSGGRAGGGGGGTLNQLSGREVRGDSIVTLFVKCTRSGGGDCVGGGGVEGGRVGYCTVYTVHHADDLRGTHSLGGKAYRPHHVHDYDEHDGLHAAVLVGE